METNVLPSKQEIEQIIKSAVQAPSGDNCQPWRFVITADSLELYNIPEADNSLYSYKQRPSLISHGAALVNLELESRFLGYQPHILLLPEGEGSTHIATIHFITIDPVEDQEHAAIFKRITNRKKYYDKPLSLDDRASIEHCIQGMGEYVGMYFVSDDQAKEIVANEASKNEYLVLSNEYLHKFLFNHIRWTAEEISKMPNGLYIDTLEMKPIEKLVFRLASSWERVKVLNLLGLNKKVSSENKKTYLSSPAFGLITVKQDNDLNYLKAGELLQKVWLNLTTRGLYLHPLTGLVFLSLRANGDGLNLNDNEKKLIKEAYGKLRDAFGSVENTFAFMFRVGSADAPSAITPRFSVEKFIKTI